MIPKGLTFDDVLLVPRRSRVFSRKDISTKTNLSRNIQLEIPLISANMDTVTESAMARVLAEAGGIGVIHRFLSIKDQVAEVRKVKRAEHIIIDDPATIEPDASVKEAREFMAREEISSLLVGKGKGSEKKLVGILTARDLLFETEHDKKIRTIMTKRVISTEKPISIEKARDILHKHKIEKLPITTKSGAIRGLITLRDILKKNKNPRAAKDCRGRLLVGAAIGVKEDTLERAEKLLAVGADVIVVDIAHGHNMRAIETVKKLRKKFGSGIEIIAGNIATKEAARDLIHAGTDGLKVGIGPGAACTTRVVTGVGVPQLTAISDVVRAAKKARVPIIADGGIRSSGDFAKALAAGAKTAMVGSLLAGCKEAPGEYIMERGAAYKYYRGMASYEASTKKTELDGESDGFVRSPEGAAGKIAYKGEAAMVLSDLLAGLRSSMSYLGAHTIAAFQKNARFIRVTDAGEKESRPHGIS